MEGVEIYSFLRMKELLFLLVEEAGDPGLRRLEGGNEVQPGKRGKALNKDSFMCREDIFFGRFDLQVTNNSSTPYKKL